MINRKIMKVEKVSIGGVEKPSKTNLSEIWGKIQGGKTSRNGRPEKREKGTRRTAKRKRTYQHIMMR